MDQTLNLKSEESKYTVKLGIRLEAFPTFQYL